MRIKIMLAATIVALTPAFAFAQGCSYGHDGQEARMSCADGTTWDADKRHLRSDGQQLTLVHGAAPPRGRADLRPNSKP